MWGGTDIGLCSRALVMLGSIPIASFDDGSEESILAEVLYEPTLADLLASYPWKFATAEMTLPRLAAAPPADFKYAYQLPADLLRVLSAGADGSTGLVYRIRERRLETDSDFVTLSYIFRPDATQWPPHFTTALVTKLSAVFALPLTESSQRAQTMMAMAEDAFRRARLIDAQQQTPQVVQDRTLLLARR